MQTLSVAATLGGGGYPPRRVRETGGESEEVSVRDSVSGELQHNWPDPLPNGRDYGDGTGQFLSTPSIVTSPRK